ncbi:2-oxo acid dehydrogenase subunit E2 [Nostoc sp. C117]|uniref:2-oxo acid dehydrogenase subunit E2 n=1 Tax=Nostoc sp. C117 TaxID=3349875 RepID=UPI00370D145F
MINILPFPNERKHTFAFLNYAKACSPVFIDTDVDMTKILNLRESSATLSQSKLSIITYFIYAAARVLSKYPEANSSLLGGLLPKLAQSDTVSAKFALDKKIGEQRVVLPGLIPHANQISLQGIQNIIDYYKLNDFDNIQEYAALKKLQKLPLFLAELIFGLILADLKRRRSRLGTFSVSSLGHKSINSFFSVGGTTLTFGLGQIQSQPVVQKEEIKIAPVMRLSMTFDHRVIDGAMAADILSDIRESLERFCE